MHNLNSWQTSQIIQLLGFPVITIKKNNHRIVFSTSSWSAAYCHYLPVVSLLLYFFSLILLSHYLSNFFFYRIFTSVIVCTCNLGACMVNVLMTGQIFESLSILSGFKMSQCYWFVIICVAMTPFTWLDTPKDFWLVGLLGTVSSVVAAVFLVVGLTQALVDDDIPKGREVTEPSARGLFLSLGTIVYGAGSTPTFPTLQHDMHAPEKFSRALVYGFIGKEKILMTRSKKLPVWLVSNSRDFPSTTHW